MSFDVHVKPAVQSDSDSGERLTDSHTLPFVFFPGGLETYCFSDFRYVHVSCAPRLSGTWTAMQKYTWRSPLLM